MNSLARRLKGLSSGRRERPSTGTPLTVSRCRPETRIWKQFGMILKSISSFSQRFERPIISPLATFMSATITVSTAWR